MDHAGTHQHAYGLSLGLGQIGLVSRTHCTLVRARMDVRLARLAVESINESWNECGSIKLDTGPTSDGTRGWHSQSRQQHPLVQELG